MKIFSIKKSYNYELLRILGIQIYKKETYPNGNTKKKILCNIIKITKDNLKKRIYLMGIKIYSKICIENLIRSEIRSNRMIILNNIQKMLSTMQLHQKTFLEYKAINTGKAVVLFGAGPTLNYYHPLKNTINVGVNRTFLFDKVKFDYIFAIDKLGIEEYYEELIKYDCTKFIGNQDYGINWQIPESIVNKMHCKRYNTTTGMDIPNKFTFDIASEPLCNFRTVSLQAMQFILYTNPKKVYIVGNDCTNSTQGHFLGKTHDISFRGENLQENDYKIIQAWKSLVDFVKTYYPETDIISVNPVGLKGLFRDVYTKEYVKEHPELLETDIKYLEDEESEDKLCV